MPDDKFDKLAIIAKETALAAASMGPFSLRTARDVAFAVLGNNDANVARAIEEDRAEQLEDLLRRVNAVEAELKSRGKDPVRANPATLLEVATEAAELLPRLVDDQVRDGVKNAFARRVVIARDSNRGLVEYWWGELRKLGEGEIRVVALAAKGRFELESKGIRYSGYGRGNDVVLSFDEKTAVEEIVFGNDSTHGHRLFEVIQGNGMVSVLLGQRGGRIWELIANPPGL